MGCHGPIIVSHIDADLSIRGYLEVGRPASSPDHIKDTFSENNYINMSPQPPLPPLFPPRPPSWRPHRLIVTPSPWPIRPMILPPPRSTAASPSSPVITTLLLAMFSSSLLLRLRSGSVRRRRRSMTTRSASVLPRLEPEPPPPARHRAARESGQLKRLRSHLHVARLRLSLQPWLRLSLSYCPPSPFPRHRLHRLLWSTSSPRR